MCRRLTAVAAAPLIQVSSASLLNTEQEEEEEDSLLRENIDGSTSERLSAVHGRTGAENILAQHRTTFDPRRKERSLNAPRYSFEDLLSEERDKDLGLSSGGVGIAVGKVRLGGAVVKDDDGVRRSVKQEAKENIFESLKNSIDKTNNYPTSRLNTRQIYNMILKETLKESEGRQRLLDNDQIKFNESSSLPPIEIKEQLPSSSSSENRVEREDDIDE
ncbi:uncharacterized protein LOC108629888 isoform X2 [Ceratina calcarata]|nr:uncharacterized protein LOC108629888 isoform X2 [Ceratina calcarata]